jgi:hypothetical protein
VGALGLGLAAFVAGPPRAHDPVAVAAPGVAAVAPGAVTAEGPAPGAVPAPVPDASPLPETVPGPEGAEVSGPAPQAEAPGADAEGGGAEGAVPPAAADPAAAAPASPAVTAAEVAPAAVPPAAPSSEAPALDGAPAAPPDPPEVPAPVPATADLPALPGPAPAEGQAEASPAVAEPPPPPAPAQGDGLLALAGEGTADRAPEVIDPAPLPAPAADGAAAEPPAVDGAAAEPPAVPVTAPEAPATQPGAPAPLAPEAPPSPDGTAPEAAPARPAAEAAVPAPASPAPALPAAGAELPRPGLDREVPGVTTGRLPTISAAPADPMSPGGAGDAPPPALAEAPGDDRPIARFSRAFANPDAKPIYAVVLVDDGADGVDRAALAALPFAVTFALDPLHPQAAAHAAIYRAGGQEVAMLSSGLPEGAAAADAEVALAEMARLLPEAIALVETVKPRFQDDRALASAVVPVLAAQGRGVLTWDRGLNAAAQVAQREGVPAAAAFRSLDAEGESTPTVRRYLDRAVFVAAQDGRVAVVGTTRPETVAGLLEWAVEGRAATVAVAPLSALLLSAAGRAP